MKKMMLLAASAASLAVAPVLAQPGGETTPQPWSDSALSPDRRVSLLVAEMTQDEKLLLVFGYFGSVIGDKKYRQPDGAIPGSAGYVPGIPRLGIPPQWQTDAGIGVASQWESPVKRGRTALPSGLALAASWNPDIARAGGAMIGSEARSSGFNVMLAGGVNLLREPRNGRNFEYGGEDPRLAGTIIGAAIAGVQSNHIISTIKHFALNDQETDRNNGNSVIDPAAARMSDLLAFQFAMEASDPGAVMCAYNRVNGPWSCESPFLLTDVLRRDWGYKGYVMSDWGGTHSTAAAANAGLDQESGYPFDEQPYFGDPLKRAVARGDVSQARLDQMATRILRSMFAHGLFDHPVAERPIDFAAHAGVTRRAAEEGAVLLKNDGGLLPLSPSGKADRRHRRSCRQGHPGGRRFVAGPSGRRQRRAGNRTRSLAGTGHLLSFLAARRNPQTRARRRGPVRERRRSARSRRPCEGQRYRSRLCHPMGGRKL